jgi:hypothetical protein
MVQWPFIPGWRKSSIHVRGVSDPSAHTLMPRRTGSATTEMPSWLDRVVAALVLLLHSAELVLGVQIDSASMMFPPSRVHRHGGVLFITIVAS